MDGFLSVFLVVRAENCFMLFALDAPFLSRGKTSLKEVIDEFLVPDVFDGETILKDAVRGWTLESEPFDDAGTVL